MSGTFTSSVQRRLEGSLDLAQTQSDDSAVWRFMQTHGASAMAQDALAEHLAKSRFQHGARTVYTQIYLMQVLAPQSGGLPGLEAWQQVSAAVNVAMHQWFPRSAGLVLFPGVTPYEWMASWTPRVFRAHLRRMNPQEKDATARVEFAARAIVLPPDAPQLGFIVIGCSTHTQWIQHRPDPGKTARLQNVVGQVLSLASAGTGASPGDSCRVWAPLPAHAAITDGMVQWLQCLHARVGIAGYAVNPSTVDRDVIEVTLQLQDEAGGRTLFQLRRHQVGHQGIATVLAGLHALAPTQVDPGLPH